MVERIGRYQILSAIGAGGMSTVYRARLVGPAQAAKEVALKVIHPHLSQDREFVLMFLDEMRLAMALAHRNIVQTFDAGVSEGTYYLVMELVGGLSLRELLDILGPAERMPLDLVLFVGAEIGAALEYAHRLEQGGQPAGVVHRDVSPGNILLSSQGDVKLADFGVAKVAGRLAVSSANIVMGKLCYMAPEQARGHGEPRSDIFALGAVLYEMLCGEPIRMASDLREVLCCARPDPARLAQQRGVSHSLRELVMRCLDPDPERRPASAGELQRRLGDELLRLPHNPRLVADAHARLQGYMALTLQQHPQQVQASEKTSALAQILLEQVRRIPTLCGLPVAEPTRPAAAALGEPLSPAAAARGQTTPPAARAQPVDGSAVTELQQGVGYRSGPEPAAPRRRVRVRGRDRLARALRAWQGKLTAVLRRHRRLLPWAGVMAGLIAGIAISWVAMRGEGPGPGTSDQPRPGPGRRTGGPGPVNENPAHRSDPGETPLEVRPAGPRHVHPSAKAAGERVPRSAARPAGRQRSRLVLISSQPRGADVFEGSRRLGKTPLPVSSARTRTLAVYAAGYEPTELTISAGAQSHPTIHLTRSVLARDVTSLRQLKLLRDSGKISEYSYKRRRAQLIAQKLLDLKVQRKTGQITEEQYQRLVESVKSGNE